MTALQIKCVWQFDIEITYDYYRIRVSQATVI